MTSLRLILAIGTMAAGFAAPAFASSTHKTYHHETSRTHHETSHYHHETSGTHHETSHYHHETSRTNHAATKHEWHHSPEKKSYHHTYRKPGRTTYHHTYRPAPKPQPKPGIRSDGRYVLPGGMETTCAGGTPPPCR